MTRIRPCFFPIFLISTLLAQPSSDLAEAYATLGFTYLDQPTTVDALKHCVKEKNQSCLSAFKAERHVARVIFSHGREAALKTTLHAIAEYCNISAQNKNNKEEWRKCRGAVVSLYFFHSDSEDQRIVHFFSKLPPAVVSNIFVESQSYSGDWISNRPDKNRWPALINSFDFLDRSPEGRAGVRSIFLDAPPPVNTLALVDPQFKLEPRLETQLQ
jgi:hypothetical protein